MVKMTNRKIKLGIDWVLKKGETVNQVAYTFDISPRRSVHRDYLESKRIIHIPSGGNNPQTNGKIERWFQEYLRHRNKFNSANEFKDWYNDRIHGSLELEWGETSNGSVC